MAEARELVAALSSVTGALDRRGIPYFITGSLASSVHGRYRATNDVDIVAQLDSADMPDLLSDLSVDFVTDIEQATNALSAGTSFNLIHRASYLKVDVFRCTSDFDREATRRAAPVTLPEAARPVRVATAEDILLAKLRWYLLGDESSESQRRDISGLIVLNRDELDFDYLRRWAGRLGVDALLQSFLASSR